MIGWGAGHCVQERIWWRTKREVQLGRLLSHPWNSWTRCQKLENWYTRGPRRLKVPIFNQIPQGNNPFFSEPSFTPPVSSADTHITKLPSNTSSDRLREPPKRRAIFSTGGIATGKQELEVLEAGASVVQVYTTLAYGGVDTIARMKDDMREEMKRRRTRQGSSWRWRMRSGSEQRLVWWEEPTSLDFVEFYDYAYVIDGTSRCWGIRWRMRWRAKIKQVALVLTLAPLSRRRYGDLLVVPTNE